MKHFNVAIVGATGLVGRMMLRVLEERAFPIASLCPFASARSAGSTLSFRSEPLTVVALTESAVRARKFDLALFSAGAEVSGTFAPIFAEAGTVVIDNSSRWRTDPDVPLVVPEVNPEALRAHRGIVANPNCSTIQSVVALKPLDDAFRLRRVVYATYQSVSGAGMAGCRDLSNGIAGIAPTSFPRPIFDNCIPQIGEFLPNGYTREEEKMRLETRKILSRPSLLVSATAVRVPVFRSHGVCIDVTCERRVSRSAVREVLRRAPGIVLADDPERGVYPTALDTTDRDEVFVGRIRVDEEANGIALWVEADNIRKGAATNAVQIAQKLAEIL